MLALCERTGVTITLPDWPGSQAVRKTLLSAGFEEQRLFSTYRSARRTGFSAATIEREVEEIARRILSYAAQGRASGRWELFCALAIPTRGWSRPRSRASGFPARVYFHQQLGSHPALMFLTNVMRAVLAGWDHAVLLAAVRMPASGIGRDGTWR